MDDKKNSKHWHTVGSVKTLADHGSLWWTSITMWSCPMQLLFCFLKLGACTKMNLLQVHRCDENNSGGAHEEAYHKMTWSIVSNSRKCPWSGVMIREWNTLRGYFHCVIFLNKKKMLSISMVTCCIHTLYASPRLTPRITCTHLWWIQSYHASPHIFKNKQTMMGLV